MNIKTYKPFCLLKVSHISIVGVKSEHSEKFHNNKSNKLDFYKMVLVLLYFKHLIQNIKNKMLYFVKNKV